MTDKPKMTKQEAIKELLNEAQELEDKPCSVSEYARNAHKIKIRRDLAKKLQQELDDEQK